MPPRFHAPDLDATATRVTLSPDESRHLARVLRLGPGATVEVFNGLGRMVRADVVDASPQRAVVDVRAEIAAQPEAPHPLVLCPALLKGDAMDAVVRDATVLGVSAIAPVVTQRTIARGSRGDAERLRQRWLRVAVAAAKQCGRAVLPQLSDPRPLDDALHDDAWRAWPRRMLVEPSAQPATDDHAESTPGAADEGRGPVGNAPLVLLVGPEGGWAADEIAAAASAGWAPWSLGPFTLRAEQVTLAALAVVRYLETHGTHDRAPDHAARLSRSP